MSARRRRADRPGEPHPRGPLAGRVALVTGAGTRVGQAIAIALGRAGADVAVHYHASSDGARATVDAVRAAGGAARAFPADLGRRGQADRLVARASAAFGRLDLLVNSAASLTRTPLATLQEADWDGIIALNLRAPLFCALAAARAMGPRGGTIVNIGDHMAYESVPDFVPHGISKAGVDAMTRHLAAVLAPRVRVNAVVPGFVLAPPGFSAARQRAVARATPLRRLGTPDDVAAAVIFLATAPYVTGETLFVDGGRHGAR